MTAQVTHSCGHKHSMPAKGVKEVRQYVKWAATIKCVECRDSKK